jgi:O-antigen/teichoic acid export membrane protein
MKLSSPRRLVLNFVFLSGGEALSKVFAFFAFAYLARILGPDIYGDIEFALAATLFFNLVVEGGLGLLGAREIAKDDRTIPELTFHIVVSARKTIGHPLRPDAFRNTRPSPMGLPGS